MKNHIKNYIKIMGLAAVPFGTAQAEDYEIKVTQEEKPDAMHFRISIGEAGKDLKVAEIVWAHKSSYPDLCSPHNLLRRIYDDTVSMAKKPICSESLPLRTACCVNQCNTRLRVWNFTKKTRKMFV